jgi:hypothetical protein
VDPDTSSDEEEGDSPDQFMDASAYHTGTCPCGQMRHPADQHILIRDADSALMTALSAYKENMSEPLTYREAVESPESDEWTDAMESEMKSLSENKTWTLVTLPVGKNIVKSKWVFKRKLKPDGSLDKYKARLVAKGYSQRKGIDFCETFAPVARYDSIRTVLSIAASCNMRLMQFDVKTAFLYGDLDEEIFMQQPTGFDDGTGRVCKLHRGLYGLKQASRQWNHKFDAFLQRHGLVKTAADPCVYTGSVNGVRTILCLYVDDGLLCSSSEGVMKKLVKDLQSEFQITTSPASCFVGLEIEQSKDSITIHQRGYLDKILDRFGMKDCKSVSTPAEPGNRRIEICRSSDLTDQKMADVPYRQAVGSLLFAAIVSRPDIAFAVSHAARFVENPGPEHWGAVKRIFRYLRGTINKSIVYRRGNNKLVGYADADWAQDCQDRKSTTGFVFCMNGGPIVWKSRRQTSVATSTLEAEYMAMADAAKECIWLRQLLNDLNWKQREITTIRVDNQAAIRLSLNPEFHNRSKHIDVRYHFLRDEVSKNKMVFKYIASKDNPADFLTKGLSSPAFINCYRILNQVQLKDGHE